MDKTILSSYSVKTYGDLKRKRWMEIDLEWHFKAMDKL